MTPSRTRLFLISALGLFLELLLIRWVTTEIRIFAYLQNTVLVVCVLGLGMGCRDARRKAFALRDALVPLAALVALLAFPPTRNTLGKISEMLSVLDGFVIWANRTASGPAEAAAAVAAGSVLTFGLLWLLWAVFVPVGRLLGGLLDADPRPIWAYSVNVAGSLAGIWLFVALSGAALPPVAWFAAAAALAVPFVGSGGRSKLGDAGLLAATVALSVAAGFEPGWQQVAWSPYQKLAVWDIETGDHGTAWARFGGARVPNTGGIGQFFIGVNNTGYQAIVDNGRAHLAGRAAADPARYPPGQLGFSQYDLPARFHPRPADGLVVGSGTGNDVAGLLRNGAERVTAVEIDPAILALGRELHPERPYSDPRATAVIDDARSFFATTAQKFDAIAFGLLDSHTSGSAMTNSRLDHYVYTRESLTHARSLLKPGGVMTVSFVPQQPFIADRLNRVLTEVFGRPPLVFAVPASGYGWGGMMFVAGDGDAAERQVRADPALAKILAEWNDPANWKGSPPVPPLPGTAEVATDDWPYIYLEGRTIPTLYVLLGGLLLALFAVGRRQLRGGGEAGWGRSGWHFFFLGAAFMLLEVQNVSKAAVVLGNTWTVNAVIVSGVLAMILLANAVAAAFPRLPNGAVYAALVGACVGLYFTDLAAFAFLPYATKAAAVGLLTSLPMLFSGIVFVRSWAVTPRKDAALGANLFGSLVGALLQTVTFVVGIKALLLIVAALYVAALLTRPRATAEPGGGSLSASEPSRAAREAPFPP